MIVKVNELTDLLNSVLGEFSLKVEPYEMTPNSVCYFVHDEKYKRFMIDLKRINPISKTRVLPSEKIQVSVCGDIQSREVIPAINLSVWLRKKVREEFMKRD